MDMLSVLCYYQIKNKVRRSRLWQKNIRSSQSSEQKNAKGNGTDTGKLTKQRHIVVPIGMCGKEDLDMRLDKIDLAEELFVVNPAGKIEMNI